MGESWRELGEGDRDGGGMGTEIGMGVRWEWKTHGD